MRICARAVAIKPGGFMEASCPSNGDIHRLCTPPVGRVHVFDTLGVAIVARDVKEVARCLQRGIVPGVSTVAGWSHLALAASLPKEVAAGMVVALLQGGADPCVATPEGLLPLHVAAYLKHHRVAHLLLASGQAATQLGAKVVCHRAWLTPLHLARNSEHGTPVTRDAFVDMLHRFQARVDWRGMPPRGPPFPDSKGRWATLACALEHGVKQSFCLRICPACGLQWITSTVPLEVAVGHRECLSTPRGPPVEPFMVWLNAMPRKVSLG